MTYATRLSAGGGVDEYEAKAFKKYSQMKAADETRAPAKLNRQANETGPDFSTAQGPAEPGTLVAE